MAQRADSIKKAVGFVRKSDAEFVNLKFVDLIGRWHQVTLPLSNFGPHTFQRGVAFDGSSIPGFTRLESGDLRLIPDAAASFIEETVDARSVSFICNCVEADTKKPFARDPRLVADRAESHLAKTRIADKAFFMPELEFNLFDEVMVMGLPEVTGYSVRSEEAGIEPEDDAKVYPWISQKGGYHALPPTDRCLSLRTLMVAEMEKAGIPVKYSHHEAGSAGQCEIEVRPATLRRAADQIMVGKHLIKTLAAAHDMVATFLPKPLYGQPGNGMHFHQNLVKGGKNMFFKRGGYGNLSKVAMYYIGGILKHGRALLALTCPTTNSYRRLVPGFEAPTCFVFAIGNRSAAVRIPKGINTADEARIEFRPSDASGNPYLSVAAMLMAGLDGIKRRIDPEKEGFGPYDLDVFGVADLEGKGITPVPFALQEALDALREDNRFLLESGVFTEDLIDMWMDLKQAEVCDTKRHPHPYEIERHLGC
ncbi:MAG: type I glutamate--ammonia ligase [Candidatus Eisenbacteria bacterium]